MKSLATLLPLLAAAEMLSAAPKPHGPPINQWTLTTGLPGENISGVWGSSPSNVYISGGFQTLDLFNGSTWSAVPLPGGIANTYRLWGLSPTDIWLAGQSALLHFDGTSWTTEFSSSDELFGVWGTSANDLFVVGDGTMRHWNGSVWTDLATGLNACYQCDRLQSVWGSSSSDVWAVGWHGSIIHWDGSTVQHFATPTASSFEAIYGTSSSDIFAAGINGMILHYDGTQWTPMQTGTTDPIYGLYAFEDDDVYAAGGNGTLLHYNGHKWSSLASGTTRDLGALFGIQNGKSRSLYAAAQSLGNDPSGNRGAILIGTQPFTTTTPEPATVVLLASGLALIFVIRKKHPSTIG